MAESVVTYIKFLTVRPDNCTGNPGEKPAEKACPVLCPTETEVGVTRRLHPPSVTGVVALLTWILGVIALPLV